ncbi:MAG: CcmD family protein [Cyclobacteriaceae bacterium]
MIKRIYLSIVLFFFTFLAFAQDKVEIDEADYANQQVEMADAFRQDGKIYVVVAVVLVILLGLLFYVYLVDRKVNRIENELNKRT